MKGDLVQDFDAREREGADVALWDKSEVYEHSAHRDQIGKIVKTALPWGLVTIRWPDGVEDTYFVGFRGRFDLVYA